MVRPSRPHNSLSIFYRVTFVCEMPYYTEVKKIQAKEMAEMKELEDKKEKEIIDAELEKVSGGHIPIFNPGGPDPEYYKPEESEPKDGGATYTW